MLPFSLVFNALPILSFMGPFVNAAIYPFNEEPVHFSRSSSLTQSSTSSTTTSQTQSSHSSVIVRSFPLGQDGVQCQFRSFNAPVQAQRGTAATTSPARKVANLSPFSCHVQCLPPSSASPNRHDCQKIITTMKQTKKAGITIGAQDWLYVSYRDCALVFQNRNSHNLAVKYRWDRLAYQADRLQAQCASGYNAQGSKSSGRCFFSTCDLDQSIQNSSTSGRQRKAGNSAPPRIENSGVVITFQRNRS
ncbi:hypothetical protein PCANC_03746 [Puccinia coronata f. sp. avenae]|uniref:Uncharacterized protein n=1 Tax=Puccinia coronata f. sp. avenae TaxID=200324 RepID=A0A2N5VVA8_9BASI|nr:hypothetical protein PCANC_03746 [Puccinia coronata f. sp. avenae]